MTDVETVFQGLEPLGASYVRRLRMRHQQHRVDSQFWLSFPLIPNEVVSALARDRYLESVIIMEWIKVSKLKLNPGKKEVLLVLGSADWHRPVNLILDRFKLSLKDQVSLIQHCLQMYQWHYFYLLHLHARSGLCWKDLILSQLSMLL